MAFKSPSCDEFHVFAISVDVSPIDSDVLIRSLSSPVRVAILVAEPSYSPAALIPREKEMGKKSAEIEPTRDITTYYKLLRRGMIHYGYKYKPGINFVRTFIPTMEPEGGFFLCRFNDIPRWLGLYDDLEFIAEAHLGYTSETVYMPHQIKTSFFIMSYPMFLWKFLEDSFNKYILVLRNPYVLRLLQWNQNDVMALDAVQAAPHSLQYVRQQTDEIIQAAVARNGLAIRYARRPTYEAFLVAVQQNGYALAYAGDRVQSYVFKRSQDLTNTLCLAAVRQNGMALCFVEHQTPEICMAAVLQTPWALQYVQQQTPELCAAAVRQNTAVRRFLWPQYACIADSAVFLRGGRRAYWPRDIRIDH